MRPTGAGQIASGVIVGVGGALCIIRGLTLKVSQVGVVDFAALSARSDLIIVGAAAISVSALLLIAGWIVRAISFLPGRDEAGMVAATSAEISVAEGDAGYAPLRGDGDNWTMWIVLGIVIVLSAMGVVATLLAG